MPESIIDFFAELEAHKVESMGWQPLVEGAYLHEGDPDAPVIEVVGIAQLDMANSSVLWLV
jgi:hypothetical protein